MKEKERNEHLLGRWPRKCKVCGKRFESGKEYAYKHRKKGKKEFWYFCSWHCLREYMKKSAA